MIAPCGLDCSKCDIYVAQSDPKTMQRIIDWYRDERHRNLRPEEVRCGGCLGDRAIHWSPDCGILKCSVDRRGLKLCSDCAEFPCERLTTWAQRSARYAEAVERLKQTRRTS